MILNLEKLSLGYIKDFIATIMFVVLAIIIKLSDKIIKKYVYLLLLLCFIIDGLFSLYPSLHNMTLENALTKL